MARAIEFGEWMEENVHETDEDKWEYADLAHMLQYAPHRLTHLGLMRNDEIDGNTAAIFDDGSICEYSDTSDCWVLSEKVAWVSTLEKFKYERPFYSEHAEEVIFDDPAYSEVIDSLIAEAWIDCEDNIDENELREELKKEFVKSLRKAVHSVGGWTPKGAK